MCDSVVADLAIAMGSRQVRFGGLGKISNVQIYDRLRWIEETFGPYFEEFHGNLRSELFDIESLLESERF